MITEIAQAAGTANPMDFMGPLMQILGWVTTFVVGILGTVFHVNSTRRVRAEAKAEAMQIGPQPFMVELKEQFITRREFDQLAAMVALSNSEMKGLFKETMNGISSQNAGLVKKIENQNERLSKKIEEVASGAYQSRQRIHLNVNAQGERIAKLEERTEFRGELQAVGEMIAEVLGNTKK